MPRPAVSLRPMTDLGIVIIGRNEGDRLWRCLHSASAGSGPVVYVDSGSTDGSVGLARSLRAEVVNLDTSIPFTAARARNAGLDRLLELAPELALVQFVDGDCEVVPGWLETARQALRDRPDLVAVCGRRRECFPGAYHYNRLCDLEWDTPVGETTACGGDAMFRVAALRAVGGFRASMIAGEEPELCTRLRAAGGKVGRLDAEMTRHDAAMTRFRQWWRRTVRAGHAFAEGHWLHRRGSVRLWVRETRSNWFWGLVLPVIALTAAWWTSGLSLLLLVGYPVLGLRIYRHGRRRGWSRSDSRLYAAFCVLGKFPAMLGQLKFHTNRLLARRTALIEYKPPANAAPDRAP